MKILALTHRLPYAPNRGDRIRSYHLLRLLATQFEVHLFSLADAADTIHTDGLREWLASVHVAVPDRIGNSVRAALGLAGGRPVTHALLDGRNAEKQIAGLAAAIRPDVTYAYCSGMARFVVDGPLQGLPSVIDMVDVDSAKWRALGATAKLPLGWVYRREARVLRQFESRASRHVAATLVVNDREREALREIAPDATIHVVENGVDLEHFAAPDMAPDSREVVFCGVMDYVPNIEGAGWFAAAVWPLVRRSVKDARFTIVGARPSAAVLKLASLPGVAVSGAVEDVRPYLWRAAVSVAPLLTARGLQNKVLEALAAGLPVVTTPAVQAGLPAAVLDGCHFSDDAGATAEAVVRLLRASPADRRRISLRADLRGLSWQSRLSGVPAILADAARSSPRKRG